VRTFIILTSYEQVMEALEAEEDMELEEDTKRNQQEDNDKGLGESNPWLKHHTKWPTRFKGRPLNILAITKKPPSTSPNSRRAGPDSEDLRPLPYNQRKRDYLLPPSYPHIRLHATGRQREMDGIQVHQKCL
jgi:hypothetical protein